MRRTIAAVAIIFAVNTPGAASAQPVAQAAAPRAGETFGFLAGSWRGPAWAQFGPKRYEFIQTERVAPHLDGHILLVEGRALDEADPMAKLFHALGILSFNPDTKAYEFRTYSGGRSGTFPARLAEGQTFLWEVSGQNGMRTRYTHRVVGNEWRGTGEASRDGVTWTPVFGMVLKRLGPASFAAPPENRP